VLELTLLAADDVALLCIPDAAFSVSVPAMASDENKKQTPTNITINRHLLLLTRPGNLTILPSFFESLAVKTNLVQ